MMRNLKDFQSLAETFGEDTQIYVEIPTGEILEIRGFQPSDLQYDGKNALIINTYGDKGKDYRKNLLKE